MTCNPILSYELRARWRMGRSFLLVLGVALALSFLAWFVYQSASLRAVNEVDGATLSRAQSVAARSSIVGRDLFVALASSNSLIWLFLAASLAASGVARERERGLLESLQLSRMTAWSQIGARLAANGLLLLVLQAVTLPVYGVAFMMGGISPGEIGAALYVVGWSAILGSALGLWFSARSHRPTGALAGALGVLIGGSLMVYISAAVYLRSPLFGGVVVDGWTEIWNFFHPTALFARLIGSRRQFYFDAGQIISIETAAWLLCSAFLLRSATLWVAKTLPPAAWQTRAPWLEKWRAEYQSRAQLRKEAAKNRASEAVQGALLADLPIDRFVHFRDPLLSREVKSRFRLRRAGFLVGLVRFALFLTAAGIWLFGIFWLFDPPSREGMAPYGLRALLYGGVGVLATLSATSFTRERESGTWESLKLSLLEPREVLRAKWRSPLISFGYYSAPLLVLLPIGALFTPPGAFLTALCIVAAWLSLTVALGLWVSWRARNSTAAIAWTAGILLMLLVGAPWLNAIAHVDENMASWKYGISSGGAYSNYSSWNYSQIYTANGNLQPSLIKRYEADTGSRGITSMPVTGYSYDGSIEQWMQRQQEKSARFVALFWSWHPGDALDTLFRDTDRRINPMSSYYQRPEASDVAGAMLIGSVGVPIALSLLLLGLLRRDVRREQLNS